MKCDMAVLGGCTNNSNNSGDHFQAEGAETRPPLALGWRLGKAQHADVDFELRLEASRLDAAKDDPENRIGVQLTARW